MMGVLGSKHTALCEATATLRVWEQHYVQQGSQYIDLLLETAAEYIAIFSDSKLLSTLFAGGR